MSSLIFILMMQYVVSTKAGMVNHVQGDVNIKASENAVAGVPIMTGPGAYAEVLLNPGSFLRISENSQVVIDNVELDNIVVRTITGAAIIEVTEIDDDFPITVNTGDLSVEIVDPGLYQFEAGRASVLSGKLRAKGTKISYKKGWAVLNGFRATKFAKNDNPTALETWSERRSTVIAGANVVSFQSFRNQNPGWSGSSWMWAPTVGIWTFMPSSRLRSPYGHRYRSYLELILAERNGYNATSDSSTGRAATSAQTAPSFGVSNGNSTGNSASSPGEYIGSKNEAVPATNP